MELVPHKVVTIIVRRLVVVMDQTMVKIVKFQEGEVDNGIVLEAEVAFVPLIARLNVVVSA